MRKSDMTLAQRFKKIERPYKTALEFLDALHSIDTNCEL